MAQTVTADAHNGARIHEQEQVPPYKFVTFSSGPGTHNSAAEKKVSPRGSHNASPSSKGVKKMRSSPRRDVPHRLPKQQEALTSQGTVGSAPPSTTTTNLDPLSEPKEPWSAAYNAFDYWCFYRIELLKYRNQQILDRWGVSKAHETRQSYDSA